MGFISPLFPEIGVVAANPIFPARRENVGGDGILERFHFVRQAGRDVEHVSRLQQDLPAIEPEGEAAGLDG
jgi:hypothetical protein